MHAYICMHACMHTHIHTMYIQYIHKLYVLPKLTLVYLRNMTKRYANDNNAPHADTFSRRTLTAEPGFV